MKKHLAIIGAVTAISAAGLTGVTIANAANTTGSTNPMSSLVDAIASKFNLSKTDVQAVFDEQHTKMQADRETEVKAEVAQLVKDGKLTQAQADALNTKRTELQKERDASRATDQNLTDAQRKAKMDERRTALDAWLKDKGIDAQYRYLLMGGRGHGPGGPDGDGPRGGHDQSSSSSTTAQ
jgi:Skp family chaperone for outer membrane proteins